MPQNYLKSFEYSTYKSSIKSYLMPFFATHVEKPPLVFYSVAKKGEISEHVTYPAHLIQ